MNATRKPSWPGLLRGTLGPLAPLVAYFLISIAIFTLGRVGLVLEYAPSLDRHGYLGLFITGLRMDAITLCQFAALPALALLLLPQRLSTISRSVIGVYLAITTGLFAFVELAGIPFFAAHASRPVLFEFGNGEIPDLLMSGDKSLTVIAVLVAGLVAYATWHVCARLLHLAPQWRIGGRTVAMPMVVGALVVGARSELGPVVANPALADFSDSPVANAIALNSTYALAFSIYRHMENDVDVERLYGSMPRSEILRRIRADMLLPAKAFTRDDIPTLHAQAAVHHLRRPLNLVVILEESLGAGLVGALGGPPLTPNLDRLSKQGILFTNLFANGIRTNRGLDAVVSGCFPAPPGTAFLKRELAQRDFFTIAQLLRRHGYNTGFVYGGEGHYDNMSSFFLGNGFQHLVVQRDYAAPVFTNPWGVSDEDLFAKATRVMRTQKEPFFELVLTLTNHPPYEFPPGRTPLYDTNHRHVVQNTARYTDYALGEFFKKARKEAFFDHTVFLIVADHPPHGSVRGSLPVNLMRIPALIIAPGLAPRRIDTLASQMDLLPTVLGLLGMDTVHPMMGRNLLAMPKRVPGRALMQYAKAYAYRRGDQVVVYEPTRQRRQFALHGDDAEPVPLDRELERDGLAHILVSNLLYEERAYRLPGEGGIVH